MQKPTFQSSILGWYYRHKRDLPWRKSNDPYIIWLSEIILQQTRVSQGLPYFEKFVKNYPLVEDLANADEDQVLKDWEGLGYYSRARNLHATAKHVSENLNCDFPRKYDELLKLKGVGSYTAAAISSFVAGEPRAVLDGNVFRVLSRYFAISTPINTTTGKKEFEQLANKMLDTKSPADYNQAIMEFGAVQCVPKNPKCGECVLNESCTAYAERNVTDFPVKEKKKYDRQRYLTYLLINNGGKIAVQQRVEKDIWRQLFQFPLIEADALLNPAEVIESINKDGLLIKEVVDLKPHKLSHQTIHCRIVLIDINKKLKLSIAEDAQWVAKEKLVDYAFPKPLRAYLDRKQLTLPID
ncbi:A/G-specific adenine glycosylase [Owenweeksia hongkongensis]|uniref:A/G-specific adenine glycosylase n=1 Tax=Owenweeksia hongkongensis TaxID=253245 RepID=UPI003A8F9655